MTTKNLSTPESRAHWQFVEQVSERVAKWPKWKRDAVMGGEMTKNAEARLLDLVDNIEREAWQEGARGGIWCRWCDGEGHHRPACRIDELRRLVMPREASPPPSPYDLSTQPGLGLRRKPR